MAISKILDISAGSKFTIKLPPDIRYDRESQNCDWVLFSVTPLLNLADSLLRTWKIEFNFLFKTCELRICIKTEFDTCKRPTPSSCETGYSLNDWLPATRYKYLFYHSNPFKINSSWCINSIIWVSVRIIINIKNTEIIQK